jgi:hypothetical protein
VFSREAWDVYRPDERLLFALRPGTIKWAACELAFPALLRAARVTTHRPIAAGGQENFRSNTVGWLNGQMTYATRSDLPGWKKIQPLLKNIAQVFAQECPEQYAVLTEAAKRTPTALLIPGTCFTSATVNRTAAHCTARMAVHRDDGNLPGAFGAMTVIRDGKHKGGLLVWPKYRVAVELHNRDCLIADNQEAHGNTAIEGGPDFERVSVVAYYQASNLKE